MNKMLFLFHMNSIQTCGKHIHLIIHFIYPTHKAAQLAIAANPELEPTVKLGGTLLYET